MSHFQMMTVMKPKQEFPRQTSHQSNLEEIAESSKTHAECKSILKNYRGCIQKCCHGYLGVANEFAESKQPEHSSVAAAAPRP